ncbi:hypothetical protein [Paractinoplanes toevensis]|uniref:Bypass of forespore C C-terminal domain-containing protein n=1 Tax=Paractinoplanes toevensis TaxID=571911 RepID=A0A919TD88_9ACTN|nr:hypothetical protein [Actinoplanes toevensis]GIM91961.1 hypothetical protein Ato02nite_037540 [Actinoplanes toevensis]
MRDRSRYLWAAVILAVSAGAAALIHSDDGRAEAAGVPARIEARMRSTLEQSDPGQHNHSGHQPAASAAVICGVRVYGYEPAQATTVAEVRTVYGFHLCGVAEPGSPWDVAVKLAGPVILDLSTDPPGIRVVEATEDVRFVDRLRQMFPERYAEMALKEGLTQSEMADLRRRYAAAAR